MILLRHKKLHQTEVNCSVVEVKSIFFHLLMCIIVLFGSKTNVTSQKLDFFSFIFIATSITDFPFVLFPVDPPPLHLPLPGPRHTIVCVHGLCIYAQSESDLLRTNS